MNRKELIEKLDVVKNAQGKEKTFSFSDGRVYSGGDLFFASVEIDCDIEVTVESKKFLAYLKKIKSEEIELSVGNTLRVSGGRSNAEFPILPATTIPHNLIESKCNIPLPLNFSEAVTNCIFSVGNFVENSKAYMNCISITKENALSTNNRTITVSKFYGNCDIDMFIPNYMCKKFSSFNPTHASVDGGWLSFKEESLIFCCRTYSEDVKFPDVKKHVDSIDNCKKIDVSKEFLDVLSTASCFLGGVSEILHVCRIIASSGELSVEIDNDSGKLKETIESACEDYKICINPKYLVELLGRKDAEYSVCSGDKIVMVKYGSSTTILSSGA